ARDVPVTDAFEAFGAEFGLLPSVHGRDAATPVLELFSVVQVRHDGVPEERELLRVRRNIVGRLRLINASVKGFLGLGLGGHLVAHIGMAPRDRVEDRDGARELSRRYPGFPAESNARFNLGSRRRYSARRAFDVRTAP